MRRFDSDALRGSNEAKKTVSRARALGVSVLISNLSMQC